MEDANKQLTEIAQGLKALAEQNKELKKELAQLKKGSSKQEPYRHNEVKEREARIVVSDGRVLVGLVNKGTEERPNYVYKRRDTNNLNKEIAIFDVIWEDKDGKRTEETYDMVEFLQNIVTSKARIVRREQEDTSYEQGITDAFSLDDNYKRTDLGEVALQVTSYDEVVVVEHNGKEYSLSQHVINLK